MPGFYVSNIGDAQLRNVRDAHCTQGVMELEGRFFCARNTLSKFLDDKTFDLDDDYCVITEGVILNKSELFEAWKADSVFDLVVKMYRERGDSFFADFRGPFSGALYDRAQDKWIFYTSHYGDSALFYYVDQNGGFAFASQVNYLLSLLRESKIELSLDEHAFYSMLTYAYMVDESTYAKEIKRLVPGTYAVIEHDDMRIRRYYKITDRKFDLAALSEDEVIEELDVRFRKAVWREFSKDEEYGHKHLCDLSGGLDSRMTTWVAHELGFEDCLNTTFCQSGYLDETIAEEIADALGNELLFKPLDTATFLFEAEHIIEMNFALSVYSGISGGEQLLKAINLDGYGLEHTGQIGDVVVGSFLSSVGEKSPVKHAGMYSSRLLGRMPDPDDGHYASQEEFMMNVRAFLGACSSHLIRSNYVVVASPFLDIDFLDFCMSIPLEMRIGHRLYRRWITSKYPRAAEFTWEREGVPLTASAPRRFIGKALHHLPFLISRKTHGKLFVSKQNMTPFEYWYERKPQIRQWINGTYKQNIGLCPSNLRGDVETLFEVGTVGEKLQVITALLALDFYFGDRDH